MNYEEKFAQRVHLLKMNNTDFKDYKAGDERGINKDWIDGLDWMQGELITKECALLTDF